jgi:VWFA-related protein
MHPMSRTVVQPRSLALAATLAALTLSVGARQATPPASPQPDRQMPPVTFRVEVNYVEVDASVFDRTGRFVGDLQADDFQVFEDGAPQKVSAFGLVEIPIERAEAPLFVRQPIEPDVQSNERPFDGRVYLLVLDELHTMSLNSVWVRAAAKKFIQTSLGANDVAAVVSIQGSATQEFTSNRRLLLAAVDRFIGRSLDSAVQNRIDSYNRSRAVGANEPPRDVDAMQREYHATLTLQALRKLSDFMASVRGRRKALVLFSEGIDYDILDFTNYQGTSQVLYDTREAIGAATRANVSFYTVDPRGLSTMPGLDASSVGPPAGVDPALNLGVTGYVQELRVQQDSLRVLAEETGGFAAINSNDFASAFERIQKENSSYYVLGYHPTNERRDGRLRTIEVRVNRAGLDVRFRKGYLAPRGKVPAPRPVDAKDGTPPELRDVLGSPLAVPGLRLAVTAVPFKGAASKVAVHLVIAPDPRDLVFTPKDGKYEDTLDLAMLVLDSRSGDSKGGQHHTLTMPLLPATYRQVLRSGLRVTSRIDVPPGHYQLRIAATERGAKRTGSVYYDLEVPDFTADPLTMSGLLISSSLAGLAPTIAGGPDDELRKALPGPPTVSRTFRAQEELALLAEVYDNEAKTPHTVDISTTVRVDDGREVYKHEDQRSSSELGGGKGGYGYTARIPLKGLSPGLYVLKVEARSRLGKGTATASREVQFRVTP